MTFLIRALLLGGLLFLACGHAVRAQEYYGVQQIDQAKAEARAKHLPIAWLSSHLRYLNANFANSAPGSDPELTVLALNTLQGQAVVIFQDGDDDLARMPQNMVDRIETKDEGELPGGWHYTAPKIIYVDPDLKNFLGCTLAPEIRSSRESAITAALLHIRNDPQAQALLNSPAAAASPAPVAAPPAAAAPSPNALATATTMIASGSFFTYVAIVLVILLAGVAFLAWRNRPVGD